MAQSLKASTLKGTLWSSLERFSVQGISFIVIIIMARILTPKDYGVVGLITIFIAVAQSLVDSGFSQALIRKKDRSQIDNSTVFYFNCVVGIALYLLLFFLAPVISRLYNEPTLIPITKVISLSVLINSFSVVQRAILTVELDFKTQAKASLISAIVSGASGIYMAYNDWGVWSIVWYQIINGGIITILLWIFSKWRPSLTFSMNSFNNLFKVGFNLAISGLVDTLYNNIYLLVIGKIFKPTDLGYYTRAQQFAIFPTANIANIIQRVSYPTLCYLNNNRSTEALRSSFMSMLRLSCFVVFPIALGLAAIAKPLILLILNSSWLFSATLLVPICIALMWYPVHVLNLNVILALGRSDIILKIEILKKVLGVSILIITIPFGLEIMCYGSAVGAFLSVYINSYSTGKYLGVGFFTQLKILSPIICNSIIMSIVIKLVAICSENPYIQITGGLLLGSMVFCILAKVFHSRALSEFISLISGFKDR